MMTFQELKHAVLHDQPCSPADLEAIASLSDSELADLEKIGAAAQPEMQAPTEPAQRADRRRRSADRSSAGEQAGPVPPEAVRQRRQRRSAYRAQSKPPKFVRSFLRSVQRSLAPFGIR